MAKKKNYPYGYQPKIVVSGRASFPALINPFTPEPDSNTGRVGLPSYQVTIMIPKEDKETYDLLQENISSMKESIKSVDRIIPDDLRDCLYDGDNQLKYEDYYGHWTIKASMKAINGFRPKLFTRDLKLVDPNAYTDDNTFIYAGCYINAEINLWYAVGVKRITANLHSVQFVKDGEKLALGTGGGGSNTLFTNLDAETEDIPF